MDKQKNIVGQSLKDWHAEKVGVNVKDNTDQDPWVNDPNGWINRSGKYFPTGGFAKHEEWAWSYLNETKGPIETAEIVSKTLSKYAHEALENFGWVRIMAWPNIKTKFIMPKKLTHAQKKTISDYCEFYELELPFNDPLFR